MSKMDKLLEAAKSAKFSNSERKDDKTFYYPARDQAGNGTAILRFLPGKTEDDLPFVKTYSHGFKGPAGKWFIEDCPTTIGSPCYCCEQNGILWNTEIKANQDIARTRKRKISYVANILVVEDKKNPENEGKVFLFKFGTKIFDKIFDKLSPEFEDETPCNVFDLLEGANFVLKIRKVEGQTNYDKSEFRTPSAIDKVNLDVLEDLNQFISPAKFKTPAELERRFNMAVGNTVRLAANAETNATENVVVRAPAAPLNTTSPSQDDVDDDVMEMMKKLAEDDEK